MILVAGERFVSVLRMAQMLNLLLLCLGEAIISLRCSGEVKTIRWLLTGVNNLSRCNELGVGELPIQVLEHWLSLDCGSVCWGSASLGERDRRQLMDSSRPLFGGQGTFSPCFEEHRCCVVCSIVGTVKSYLDSDGAPSRSRF